MKHEPDGGKQRAPEGLSKEVRNRCDKERKKFRITPGYILAWFAVLIIQGGHFGSNKPPSKALWKKAPRGIGLPYIRNWMTRDAYECGATSIL